jgi:hypothetical protein
VELSSSRRSFDPCVAWAYPLMHATNDGRWWSCMRRSLADHTDVTNGLLPPYTRDVRFFLPSHFGIDT